MSTQDASASETAPTSSRFWRTAGMALLAGLVCAVGAILGIAIGANDGTPHSMGLLAVFGMLAISIAVAFFLPRAWQNHYVRSLPFFWICIGGSLIAQLYFGVENSIATSMAIIIAIPVGHLTGQQIVTRFPSGREESR
ncbi:MAG: hypothetical protein AB7V46_18820 [Thermomicrobiales bacterium]